MPYEPTAAVLNNIRNTLSNYCIALDTKEFALLHSVFTKDVVCDYTAVSPTNPSIVGIEKFLERIQIILKGRITQHALSTQRLEFSETRDEGVICNAMTYFTANTFTTEEGGLNHVSVFGYYVDRLKEVDGKWLVFERKVNSFVSILLWLFVLNLGLKDVRLMSVASED
ncbi:hypothetical protein E2P81_ATG08316 [Venturia nashicola]|uniref:SnoaL-like domain-containing protein n=1 Tax=Venturia nashicola TaxID=86259 RepID=A0A4Z1P4W4_9PEZI|nr:hypothetical protein E6O75_ATG08503 [Venturia nashicola]TLD21728.1 hypothetical protein E2P81_ATG08316 [Venturia nashicola]